MDKASTSAASVREPSPAGSELDVCVTARPLGATDVTDIICREIALLRSILEFRPSE